MYEAHRFAHQHGGDVEILCGDGLFEGAYRVRQRRRQLFLVAMPGADERIGERPLVVFGRPIQTPHNVIDPRAERVVAAGPNSPLMRARRHQRLGGGPKPGAHQHAIGTEGKRRR